MDHGKTSAHISGQKPLESVLQDVLYTRPYHHLVHFDECRFYDELSWGLEYYGYISHVLSLPIKGLVADVGCGDGKVTIELARKNPNLIFHGYDLSQKPILFARAYALPNTQFYDQSFSDARERYDTIVCVETFEHIPDEGIPEFTQSLRDHLAPGGMLIVTVPTINRPRNVKHYRHYDLKTLEQHVGLSSQEHWYIHNERSNWIRSLLSNQFFILKKGRRWLFSLYKRWYQFSPNGTHLVATFTKK